MRARHHPLHFSKAFYLNIAVTPPSSGNITPVTHDARSLAN
ncbi:hypothetical protein [Bacillus solimangrovi]|nr:hypothetical protein [Bacillus solimangrovi]